MSAMYIIKDALEKAGFATKAEGAEKEEPVAKPAVSGHVAMDAVRRALDAAAPWWQSQGAKPKNGERIVNSPVEKETRPTALGAGKHMEAMQRKAGSRPPIGELPDTPKVMTGDEAIAEDFFALDDFAMDAFKEGAEIKQMQSELAEHDRKNHPGGYKGGRCILRGKISKAAKNLGMGGQAIKNLVGPKADGGAAGSAGGAGGTEKVETKEEVAVTETLDPKEKKDGAESGGEVGTGGGGEGSPEVPDEVEKAFFDKMSQIDEKRKQLLEEAKNSPDRKQKETKIAKNYKRLKQQARLEYLTNALQMKPSEAGACAEIAEKYEEGSPEAKKVVEELAQNPNLTDQQKAALEVVNESAQKGEAPEASGNTETAEQPDGGEKATQAEGASAPEAMGGENSATGTGEETDDDFAKELKALMPADKAQMVDTLSQKFDGLNTSLNDEQKKKFWELNNGGDEDAFYDFLTTPEVGFTEEEVSALRDLTDAYRAANPNDYPEYAKQHQYDALRREVFNTVGHRFRSELAGNGSKKPMLAQGIADRLAAKGFDKKQIVDFMKSEGINEELATAIVNGDPVDPELDQKEAERISAKDQLAKKKSSLEMDELSSREKYNKERDKAAKDKKRGDPETETKLKNLYDKWKAARDNLAAFKKEQSRKPQPTAAPAQEAPAPAEGTSSSETSAPAPDVTATKEDVAKQLPGDPIDEGTTPEDHAKVCKANPKRNCPFLKAHMAPEALAALDKPKGAQSAATGETATPAPATGETAAPATGTAQPTAEPSDGAVPPDSSGGETSAPSAENTEPSTETAAPAAETEAPSAAPPPLPDYELPKVDGVSLPDAAKQDLSAIKDAYNNSNTDEERQKFRELYEEYTAELDAQAALQQAKNDIDEDARAQEMEKKQPGFIQNMKDFFGGMLKSMKGDKPIGFEMSPEERRDLGLPETGTIRKSEFLAANARATARENARKAEEAKKGKANNSEIMNQLPAVDGIKLADASLLDPVNKETETDKDAVEAADAITEKMKDFGDVKSSKTTVGDSATTVELTVGKGFDFEKAKRSLNQISLESGATVTSVNIVEGKKNTIAVQFNNRKAREVQMSAVIGTDEWKKQVAKPGVPVAFGRSATGEPFVRDLTKMPHTAITGATESGKSVCLQSLLASSQMARTPKQLRQVCIDGKGLEFGDQMGSPYNLYPPAKNPKDVAKILRSLKHEMEERSKKIGVNFDDYDETKDLAAEKGSRNLVSYNEGKPEDEQLPHIVTYIDELAEYTKDKEYGPEIIAALDSLLAKGRAVGMNFVLSSQKNDVESFPGAIKANLPGRMIFQASKSDTTADKEAKDLKGRGDMILQDRDGKRTRGRGTYIKDHEIEKISNHYIDQNPRARENNQDTSAKPTSNPNAPQRVPKGKRSSPTHIANMPDGMEVHRGPGNTLIFKHGGRQYKQVQRRTKEGQVKYYWKLADGSDPRPYTFDKPSPPPAS